MAPCRLRTTLERRYPAGETLDSPLALIVWENIGYLIDDERRGALFEEFKARIGLTPGGIARPDGAVLLDIARRGGLRALPLAKARSILKRFPAIGDPGADKILLFCNIAPRPCLESNGVRALARLGFFVEQRSYAASYGAAVKAWWSATGWSPPSSPCANTAGRCADAPRRSA